MFPNVSAVSCARERARARVGVLLSSSGVSYASCARVCVAGVSLEFFWRFICFVCACACCWHFS